MNYLAHLVLSGEASDGMVGNFIGDAVKGAPERQVSAGIAQGVRLHRWIDGYADAHPAARKARARLRPLLGRFSAVGVDLLYDHFLARNFEELTGSGPLEIFALETERYLASRTADMPQRSVRFFEAMVAHRWLVGYATQHGMESVCRSMDARLEQRTGTRGTLHQLFPAAQRGGWAELEADFQQFWADIVSQRATWKPGCVQQQCGVHN